MPSQSTEMSLSRPEPLCLRHAAELIKHDYLPFEAGFAIDAEGMYHVAASTYMRNITGKMIDWWFGYVHKTDSYLLWHPRDHVFSDWEGPREGPQGGAYIGGSHLVQEYIGGELCTLKISFVDPGTYFGSQWRANFDAAGYSTAICGRVGMWNREDNSVVYVGHLIHLIKDEPDGVRMRSRFWLGDIEGVSPSEARAKISDSMPMDLCKHATEEMAILADILPQLYSRLCEAK